ncbi:MAG TPA: polysaccharide biosynthesis tyrosine autokinase [Vicinamibacterales bacterium]|jgi:capsular exopolysaccharide synthesis family protein|nr:polysaccharide biosynthesis tyrosine autokinase [Vicinamibacterales bacterium]
MRTSAHTPTPKHPGLPLTSGRSVEVHLFDKARALLRYKWPAASAFAVVLGVAALQAYSQTPLYRASARLLIELEDERSLAMEGVGSTKTNEYTYDPEPYFQTQYRILTGRELAERVVGTLDLRSMPDLNGSAPPRRGVAKAIATVRGTLENWARSVTGRSAPADAGPPSREALVALFSSRVSVEPVRASRLVDVTFVSSDPGTAAHAINALVDEYVKQNLAVRQQDMSKSLMWLSEELERQQSRVEDSERAMAEYRAGHNAGSLRDRENIVTSRLNQLNESATRARTARAQKESLYKQIEALGPAAAAETVPAIASNPSVQAIKATLAELQRQKTLLSERYGDKHPEMVTVMASIQDATRQLNIELSKAVEAIRHDFESAVLEEKTLALALSDQQVVAADLDRKGVAYTVMEREAQSNRQLYETLLQREKELQVLANSRGNNVRLIDRATMPSAPFAPNINRSLMLGSLAGLLVAFGLVFALDSFDDTIKSAEDITRKLGLPCLGLVPDVRPRSDRPVVSANSSGDFGEAIRSLRTSVAFSSETEGSAVILVTSAQPLEGKTTTACNLAMAMAYGGAKVLLVDADLRRPSVHNGFGLENRVGLSDVLSGRTPLASAVYRLSSPDNLWVMTAGDPPHNPSELLGSKRMDNLFQQMRTGPFEWVIIDTPPVLAVTDASILAREATGVAFVLGASMTRRRLAERAIETLAIGGPRILGAVLNRVEASRETYSYSDYRREDAVHLSSA